MKRRTLQRLLGAGIVPLMAFAACADSGEETKYVQADSGIPESGPPDGNDAAAPDRRDVDAEAIRCSEDFCIVDLPNPQAYGFTQWAFAGVQVDPVIGAWAIANGVYGVDKASAQILHFENGAWRPMHSPSLGGGGGKRAVELFSLASDGAGNLIAVGATLDDRTAVIVRGEGTTFTTTTFDDGSLSAAWYAAPGQAWVVGAGGRIYRSSSDGGWESESIDAPADFGAVWGSGPDDLYVGGVDVDPETFVSSGYLGHRTRDDAGVPNWTFRRFDDLQDMRAGDRSILAGVAPPDGTRFWAAPNLLARTAPGGGHDEWVADPFEPRAEIRAFWARGKDNVWAVGHVGRVFHFDGTAWKDSLLTFNGAPLTSHLRAIAGTSAGEIFVVGEGVALWRQAQ
jgi:hypothetical protein